MDKNNLIGMVLIFVCLMAYMQLNQPTPEQLAKEERIRDSIALAQQTNVIAEGEGIVSAEKVSNSISPTWSKRILTGLIFRDFLFLRCFDIFPLCSMSFPSTQVITASTLRFL